MIDEKDKCDTKDSSDDDKNNATTSDKITSETRLSNSADTEPCLNISTKVEKSDKSNSGAKDNIKEESRIRQ